MFDIILYIEHPLYPDKNGGSIEIRFLIVFSEKRILSKGVSSAVLSGIVSASERPDVFWNATNDSHWRKKLRSI